MRTHIRSGRVAFIGLLLAVSTGCHTLRPSTPLAVHVRDAETQAPVPGATVRLWRFGSHSEERDLGIATAADGVAHARLAPPDEGGVMVEVSAPGYLSTQTTMPKDVADALASAKPFQPYKGPPLAVNVDLFAGPRPVVELVLPGGYRGMVKVDIRVRPDGPWQPGQRSFTYDVPRNGVVQVDGPPVFGQGVGPEIIAKFADGTALPKDAKNNETALRWVRREGGTVYFAVGTASEAEVVRRAVGKPGDTDLVREASANDRPRGGGGQRGGRGGRGGMGR